MGIPEADIMTAFKRLTNEAPVLAVSGLDYVPHFLRDEEEVELIRAVDKQPWITDLKRRVQHYGYRYDYKARGLMGNLYLGPIPAWLQPYCNRLRTDGHFNTRPDQVIVNEYLPGQGIASHTDCIPCFGETIASISLGSPCSMDFTNGAMKASLYLEQRSLLILSGDARYQWKHAIAARKSDKVNNITTPRARRISLTFRTVLSA